MKIFLFYDLNGSLYAYTDKKELKDMFISQRIENKFIYKTIRISKDEFNRFSFSNNRQELTYLPLYDGTSYITVAATINEDDMLTIFMESISNKMTVLRNKLLSINFKNKYIKLISDITDELFEEIPRSDDGDKYDRYLNIDMFHAFYYINKDTLSEIE